MLINIIAAIAEENNGIGKNNGLLWHIPEDLKHFKELTTGHAIIMGRKTFESIGRPLPHRTNIIISRDEKWQPGQGVIKSKSISEALEKAKNFEQEEVFIIGGGQIYAQTINLADRLYLTKVSGSYNDADIFFPPYKDRFIMKSEKKTIVDNNITLAFQLWVKKQ